MSLVYQTNQGDKLTPSALYLLHIDQVCCFLFDLLNEINKDKNNTHSSSYYSPVNNIGDKFDQKICTRESIIRRYNMYLCVFSVVSRYFLCPYAPFSVVKVI